jgi:membrane protease YdiL (CAAX protease family)
LSQASAARLRPPFKTAAQEAVGLWGLCFGLIVVTYLANPSWAKVVATVGFLYLPLWALRERDEDYAEYGVTFRNWKADLKLAGIILAILIPATTLGFWGWAEFVPRLPPEVAHLISPNTGHYEIAFRLPDRFAEWVIDQLFVVALPEEFFYRGFMQTRLKDAWPQGRVIFGVRMGPAFFWTAALFALGHLAIFQVWRLGVFFPALLFGWMREKTGTVMSAALVHGVANLLMKVLEASFYGQT